MNWFDSAKEILAKWKARQIASSARFTPRAQQVYVLARKEAEELNHSYIGTEHILLGIIKLGKGVAFNVLLQKLGLDLEIMHRAAEKKIVTGRDQKKVGNLSYTPRVKMVIALAVREAKKLNTTTLARNICYSACCAKAVA
jgi:ATP-dependent Clp protease ATP-binding subunit ClpA